MLAVCATAGFGELIPVGYVSWDVAFPGNAGEFDIINQTGPNSSVFPNTTFPITTTLSLSSLLLVVHFDDGATTVDGSSYFTLSGDGESFNGTAIPIGGTNPLPTSATLTGDFSPTTVTVNPDRTVTILPTFSTTLVDSPNLVDGDLGIIYATTATSAVPEPGLRILLTIALGSLMIARGGQAMRKQKRDSKSREERCVRAWS